MVRLDATFTRDYRVASPGSSEIDCVTGVETVYVSLATPFV